MSDQTYQEKRRSLEQRKALLEKLIPMTENEVIATALRADYRGVINDLELFYYDEKEIKQ